MRITARVITLAFAASVMLSAVAPARAETDAEIEQTVRRQVQPMLIAAGGMAVALNIDGRTLLFNYGLADAARKTPISSDSLFNLASVGKAFTAMSLPGLTRQSICFEKMSFAKNDGPAGQARG
jgi:beta-lactamase class C